MAKKDQTVKAKPNCIYCKYGTDIGNHMHECSFLQYPRSNGIRGRIQCDVGQFELDEKRYINYSKINDKYIVKKYVSDNKSTEVLFQGNYFDCQSFISNISKDDGNLELVKL